MPQTASFISIENQTENDLIFKKAISLLEVAESDWFGHNPTAAVTNLIKALQHLNHLEGSQTVLLHTAGAYQRLGIIYHSQLQLNDANNAIRESLHLYNQLALRDPEKILPTIIQVIGDLTPMYLSDPSSSLAFEEILPQINLIFENHSKELAPTYAQVLSQWGEIMLKNLRYEQAQNVLKKALYLHQVLAASNPKKYATLLAQTVMLMGTLKHQTGNPQEAENLFFQAKELFESAINIDSTRWYDDLAFLLQHLSDILQEKDKPAEAMDLLIAAAKLLEALAQQWPSHYSKDLADCYNKCGNLMRNEFRNLEQAAFYFNKAAELKA